jgi:hypothetical protein
MGTTASGATPPLGARSSWRAIPRTRPVGVPREEPGDTREHGRLAITGAT